MRYQSSLCIRHLIEQQKMDQGPESSTLSKMLPPKPRLLDQVRATIRGKHYSRRTEKTYIHWIKRFIYFTGKRQQSSMPT